MSENKKSSYQKALLEAREIEKSAVESAKRLVEESVIPEIEKTVRETVQELEEGVTIDVGDANIDVSVEDGNTSIKVDAEEEDVKISAEDEESEEEEMEDLDSEDNEEEEDFDSEEDEFDSEEDEDENEDDEEDEEDDLVFEVEGLNEEDEEISAEEIPAEEAPAEDLDIDEGGESNFPGLEELSSKLDTIIDKLGSAEENAEDFDEPTEEVGEESPEDIGAEGEVEIVDDEAPAEEAPAEEAPAEEVPAEGGEEMVSEDDFMEITFEEEEQDDNMFDIDLEEMMDEIEIVDEDEDEHDDDEDIDEMHGVGHNMRHSNKAGKLPRDVQYRKEINENKNKTQKEAKNAELEQENESLRESLKEYKESFKILRKQINEVQTFNAKLAYVNKLFSKGGLTNNEKIQIAEDFDRAGTAEEAKRIYNKIISENKEFKDSKSDKLRNKLKSAKPAAITPSTQTETLYENKEVSRMKLLAGIKSNTSEK